MTIANASPNVQPELGWLAALLAPRDVAPHPNFWTGDVVTPYGVLGLLAAGRRSDYGRLTTFDRDADKAASVSRFGPLYEAFLDSMTVGTVEQGAVQLREMSLNGLGDYRDIGFRCACAVLAASALSEVEKFAEADQALRGVLKSLDVERSAAEGLLAAWLLCVRSLHYWDSGQDPRRLVRDALRLCEQLDVESLPEFEVSTGSPRDVREITIDLIESIEWVGHSYLARTATSVDERLAPLRRRTPIAVWRSRGHAADSLSERLKHDFKRLFSSAVEITYSFGNVNIPGDRDLSESLLWHEYSGSSVAHHYRELLGLARFRQGRADGESWLMAEGLRLLRQANSEKNVEFACASLLREGPLQVLQQDASLVIRRLHEGQLRQVELVVLKYAAPVLDEGARVEALNGLFEIRNVPPVQRGASWQHSGVYAEKVWTAIRELARANGSGVEKLSVLLSDIVRLADANEEGGIDHFMARVLDRWSAEDWKDHGVMEQVRSMRLHASLAEWKQVRVSLERVADSNPELAEYNFAAPTDVASVARRVDRSLHDVESLDQGVVETAMGIIRDDLRRLESTASSGIFTGGSIATADVAVALMLQTGRDDLWPDVLRTLTDPEVQRDDKTAALERMTRNVKKMPVLVAECAAERTGELLSGGPAFADDVLSPYPAAVRFLAAIGVLEPAEAVQFVAGLMARRTSQAMREAAHTVVVLAPDGDGQPWVTTVSVWLTFDSDVEVRSLAGQALGLAAERLSGAELDRLRALLEQDGTSVPRHVIAGLSDSGFRLPESIKATMQSLAGTHLSADVRAEAAVLLERDAKLRREQAEKDAEGQQRRWWKRS
ncbi:hypothetical protein [Nocardioides nanhaiensis]|uniref:HEAT repeat domain-containing protein n=1 Tax=Nocardioides nanhaiensis TaxID=1476871 RepID=A0ABP8VW20_9ACTN